MYTRLQGWVEEREREGKLDAGRPRKKRRIGQGEEDVFPTTEGKDVPEVKRAVDTRTDMCRYNLLARLYRLVRT
jgi:hypothetical protein